jgi:hypothetical protein
MSITLSPEDLNELRTTYILIAHHQSLITQLQSRQASITNPYIPDQSKNWQANLDTGEIIESGTNGDRPDIRVVRPDGSEDRQVTDAGINEPESED